MAALPRVEEVKHAWLKAGGVWHHAPEESHHTGDAVTTTCGQQVPFDIIEASLRGGPPTNVGDVICEKCAASDVANVQKS